MDTWALGLSLWVCLFGDHPFWDGSENESSIEAKIVTLPISFEDRECSKEVQEVLHGLLDKDSAKRLEIESVLALDWFK